MLDEVFARATRDELTERFDADDVWWAPVNTPAEVLEDPQALAAGGFVDVPEGEGAPAHRAVATPVLFHGHGVLPVGAVPGLGEHTDEVLRSAGFEPDELERFRSAGAIAPSAERRVARSVELAQHVVHLEAEPAQLVAVERPSSDASFCSPYVGEPTCSWRRPSCASASVTIRPACGGPRPRARRPSGASAAADRPPRRWLAVLGGPALDGEEQLVLGRREAGGPRRVLGEALEHPERVAEVGQRLVVGVVEIGRPAVIRRPRSPVRASTAPVAADCRSASPGGSTARGRPIAATRVVGSSGETRPSR